MKKKTDLIITLNIIKEIPLKISLTSNYISYSTSYFLEKDIKEQLNKYFSDILAYKGSSVLFKMHEKLVRYGLIPYLNINNAMIFADNRFFKVIVKNRLVAYFMDVIIKNNRNKLNELYIRKNHYTIDNYLTEIIDFSRRIDLMLECSNIKEKIKFKNGFDHDNQFLNKERNLLDVDINKNILDNISNLWINFTKIKNILENESIYLKLKHRNAVYMKKMSIEWSELDVLLIPISNINELEGYLISTRYWDNIGLYLYNEKKDYFLNTKEIEREVNKNNIQIIND